MLSWLLVAHVVVLGYWLGSEFVINATYRYVCYSTDTPFAERTRLMDHVMRVDQHVRYALILQVTLGSLLCVKLGYLPGGAPLFAVVAVAGFVWLVFVELVHQLRHHKLGPQLARGDRMLRYLLVVLIIAIALGLVGHGWNIPAWLRWKLAAFAGVMACGIGIRLVLLDHFRTWREMEVSGVTSQSNARIKLAYRRSTTVLLMLWGFIAAIVYLSVARPT